MSDDIDHDWLFGKPSALLFGSRSPPLLREIMGGNRFSLSRSPSLAEVGRLACQRLTFSPVDGRQEGSIPPCNRAPRYGNFGQSLDFRPQRDRWHLIE